MFRFFRSIRQNLIFQKKIYKYALYAIGEIFLVVVGILIALQINNWNENQKNERESRIYLKRIISDLEADIIEADETADNYIKRIILILDVLRELGEDPMSKFYCDVILEEIDSEGKPKEPNKWISSKIMESFSKKLVNVYGTRTFDHTNIAFQEMITTGKIDIIADQDLKNEIQNHYVNLEEISGFQRLVSEVAEDYRKALIKNKISNLDNLKRTQVEEKIHQREDLIVALENYLDLSCRGAQVLFFRENSVKPSSERMIQKLEKYLN